MESVWSKSCDIPEREALAEDISTDAAIIGGGLAGILTAYLLQKRGVRTVVLEARRTGSGQTGNTTAKITSQHGVIYSKLIKSFGLEKAKLYAEANEEAIRRYREIIEENGIDCNFEGKRACIYTLGDTEELMGEEEAAKKCGIDAHYTLNAPLPLEVRGALYFEGQAQFNPMKFIRAISEELTIFEKTMVTGVKDKVITANSHTVRANKIIMASHYPIINVPGYFFVRMHQERSYVIALEGALDVDGMYIGTGGCSLSFRNYENLLLLGGENHRSGENKEGGRYEALREEARKLFPGSREVAYWSAQDCMTLDDVPYIGQFSRATPDMFVATGFKKWGMTSSMVAAMINSDLVCVLVNPYSEVFTPLRSDVAKGPDKFIDEGAHAVKGLGKRIFKIPDTTLSKIQPGHGGIVELDGEKVGVYKNEAGEVFPVSIKCTHLGCQLEWNPDELSWDCPCHGSRFDYKGKLINNPALKNLENPLSDE